MTTTSDPTGGAHPDAEAARLWRVHRPHLLDLAYRMLGDIGDAEDTVQETYLRFAAAGPQHVADAGGWLAVVTSRLCLDQLRSARRRRERPRDPTDPAGPPHASDPGAHAGSVPVDPADRVTLDDQVRRALADVLDRLGPAERVAFILHDVFSAPFDEIATVLGRSTESCRQLASRARRRVVDGGRPSIRPGDGAPAPNPDAVTAAFIAACAGHDLEALVGLLAPDAWGVARPGPGRAPVTQHGARVVAGTLLRYWSTATLVTDRRTARPTLLAFEARRSVGSITLDVRDGRVRSVEVVATGGGPG